MSHFRVHQPVHEPAVRHAPTTKPGPYRKIDESMKSPRCSPDLFTQGGAVYIGINGHRYIELAAYLPGDVGV